MTHPFSFSPLRLSLYSQSILYPCLPNLSLILSIYYDNLSNPEVMFGSGQFYPSSSLPSSPNHSSYLPCHTRHLFSPMIKRLEAVLIYTPFTHAGRSFSSTPFTVTSRFCLRRITVPSTRMVTDLVQDGN